jgi:antirestriction protein ArdC
MTPVPSFPRQDVHQAITDKIVQAIEAGAGPFVMPWHTRQVAAGRPTNARTLNPYRGINVVALWAEAMLAERTTGFWATYQQWSELGAQVRRGERGATIVFYKPLHPTDGEEDEADRPRRVARASTVFHQDQVDGWAPLAYTNGGADIIASGEALLALSGATVRFGEALACYDRGRDMILMPDRRDFHRTPTSTATEAFYGTLFHELTHWTGAGHRLDRTFGVRFGDQAYAMEELVAELGAAFLCADQGIANKPRPDHAAYVASWLKVLRSDARAIFVAARAASTAAGYLTDCEP